MNKSFVRTTYDDVTYLPFTSCYYLWASNNNVHQIVACKTTQLDNYDMHTYLGGKRDYKHYTTDRFLHQKERARVSV